MESACVLVPRRSTCLCRQRGELSPHQCASAPAQATASPAACYQELRRFPAVTHAALGSTAGGQTFLLYTECSRHDVPRHRLLRFSRHYSLQRTAGGLAVSRAALSAEFHNQLLSQDSPSGQHRAVLSRCPWQGHELLEVWGSSGRSHSVDLTALGKHGKVYAEGPFACLAWSHSEAQLLYVAEKSRPKPRPPGPWDVPGAARLVEEDEDEVVAVLPPAGQELPLCWVPVEDAPTVPGVTWKTLTVQPPCNGQSPTAHSTQAFEALLLSPPESMAPHPLVVCPHGGPHAVFDARWRPSMAALCQLGFAVLLVNYRGSLGFGQASITSLLSRVGEQDVADTQLAVEQALHSEPLDPHRLALLAGSHGAFIALHLLAREPKRYQACALRSPVSNLPALLGTSDIPDWRYVSLGLPYSFERVPRAEEVATMLLRSPIAQVAQVQTPVLLCVGGRDRRVSPTQALELYRVLRAKGVPARLLWYPEGGHALTGVETEADVFGNCARWFLQHVGQPWRDRMGRHST
ncbi:hypothetical protein AV530_004188 [Patagioenas fasciata monilis]|uniref:acylaminoacyl-peptidase n=1 Tax=Patagioenas fasciata monilis TaxID=372326 RepID=A0A1V4K8H5_PATFA|nr:hypothetical protein AV530_004188 [Patagioenas fasciata monilis]